MVPEENFAHLLMLLEYSRYPKDLFLPLSKELMWTTKSRMLPEIFYKKPSQFSLFHQSGMIYWSEGWTRYVQFQLDFILEQESFFWFILYIPWLNKEGGYCYTMILNQKRYFMKRQINSLYQLLSQFPLTDWNKRKELVDLFHPKTAGIMNFLSYNRLIHQIISPHINNYYKL